MSRLQNRCLRPVRVDSFLEDGLDLKIDRDLVADDGAAAGPAVDAEVAAVDPQGRGEAGALAAVRIHAEPVHRDREWYRPAHAAQRQFTSTTQPPSAWRTPVEQ